MEDQRDQRETAPEANGQRGRVVVGVDGSAGARVALIQAIGEATRRGADLDVVTACHVVQPWTMGRPLLPPETDSLLEEGRSQARAWVDEASTDPAVAAMPGFDAVRARVVAVADAPVPALVERSEGAELLVVGSRGRGAVRSALLGSVALHCITHARCPVLVVRDRPDAPPPQARVVAGLDGSRDSLAACRLAVEEAVRRGVDVEVVAAYALADYWSGPRSIAVPSPEQVGRLVQDRAERLTENIRQLPGAGPGARMPEVHVHVVEGPAKDVLVQRSQTASLVVVGGRGSGAVRGLLLGSVALHVAMHAASPVLVAHGVEPLPDVASSVASEALTPG